MNSLERFSSNNIAEQILKSDANATQFRHCILTSFIETIGNLPAPLYKEPPSIIQWLYDYLSSNEVSRFVNASIFSFVFLLCFCLFVCFGEAEAGVIKKTNQSQQQQRKSETRHEAKYGAVVCDLNDHVQIVGWSLSNASLLLLLLSLLLLLLLQVKPFQLLPETTKHIFNIIMVSEAVKTFAQEN